MRRVIDSHAHVVQYIAGTGAGGELRSIGNGMAIYANRQKVRMIPKEFRGDCVSPEQLLRVMDACGVEKAVLLQGNFYGYQNYYTYQAVKKYPDRFAGAGSYDPFSGDRDGIRKFLFEDLDFSIVKFEVSTGSGLMAIHPDLVLDGDVMREAASYASQKGHVFVIDIGKCASASWQVERLRNLAAAFPDMKFVACHLLAPSARDQNLLDWALHILKLPNLWFDLSSLVHNCREADKPYETALSYIRKAANLVGTEKLMFGTDFPSALKEAPYEAYIRLFEESNRFSDKEKEQMLYENAQMVYFENQS